MGWKSSSISQFLVGADVSVPTTQRRSFYNRNGNNDQEDVLMEYLHGKSVEEASGGMVVVSLGVLRETTDPLQLRNVTA